MQFWRLSKQDRTMSGKSVSALRPQWASGRKSWTKQSGEGFPWCRNAEGSRADRGGWQNGTPNGPPPRWRWSANESCPRSTRFLPAEIDGTSRDIWLALDCLQDPQNVGAILRSAAFFGVRGILVTKDRSAPLNATVYDISAGGMEFLPVCVVSNLTRAIDQSKERGLWILGTSEHAEQTVNDITRDRPRLVIVGNEQKGMRHLTSEKCDELCRLDPRGEVTSLNASVAAGVVLATLTGD